MIAHIDRNSEGYKRLLRLTYQGQIEVWERMQAILNGGKFDQATSLFPKQPITVAPAVTVAQKPASHMQTSSSAIALISVKELLDRFLVAHPKRNERWKKDMQTAFQPLMELVGADTDACPPSAPMAQI